MRKKMRRRQKREAAYTFIKQKLCGIQRFIFERQRKKSKRRGSDPFLISDIFNEIMQR